MKIRKIRRRELNVSAMSADFLIKEQYKRRKVTSNAK